MKDESVFICTKLPFIPHVTRFGHRWRRTQGYCVQVEVYLDACPLIGPVYVNDLQQSCWLSWRYNWSDQYCVLHSGHYSTSVLTSFCLTYLTTSWLLYSHNHCQCTADSSRATWVAILRDAHPTSTWPAVQTISFRRIEQKVHLCISVAWYPVAPDVSLLLSFFQHVSPTKSMPYGHITFKRRFSYYHRS